jgi:ferredoxin
MTVDNTWIDNVPPRESSYWTQVRAKAAELQSDGCTGVSDICIDSCYEHDIHWRTGQTIYGVDITTAQANRRFRKVIEARFAEHDNRVMRALATPIGYGFAWGRFLGVSIGGHFLKHKSA